MRAKAGEESAVRQLIVAVAPVMIGATRRVMGSQHPDVEDALQESSVGFLRALSTYRSGCSVKHFASRIATLTALTLRRNRRNKERFTPSAPHDEMDGAAAEGIDAVTRVVQERQRQALRRILDELPEPQAEALTLYAVLGWTVEEIAGVADVPENTVRSRLRLAKESLRKRITEDPRLSIELGELP
jgi:RNA polymerase sigma factor (sigma-70 family)